MAKKYYPLIAAIGWLAACTTLLILPGDKFATESWIEKILNKIWFDKWVHIGLFASLTVIWCLGWRSVARNPVAPALKKAFIIIGILSLAYGIAMEFVQRYCIPDRSFDMLDIVADGLGSVAGIIFSTGRYIKK